MPLSADLNIPDFDPHLLLEKRAKLDKQAIMMPIRYAIAVAKHVPVSAVLFKIRGQGMRWISAAAKRNDNQCDKYAEASIKDCACDKRRS
jgi:hypothetical protein